VFTGIRGSSHRTTRLASLASAIVGLAFLPASTMTDLDPVLNVAPFAALAFLVELAIVLAFRCDLLVVAFAALAFVGPASLIGPEIFAAINAERAFVGDKPSLKVLTVNVWSRNTNYQAVMKLVAAEQPDVILVQEAFQGWSLILGKYLPPYSFAAGCVWLSDCNVAVLSKLQRATGEPRYESSQITAHLILPDRFGGGAFEATSIHLSRPPPMEKQISQVTELERAADSFSDLAIVAGDFNSTPWTGIIRRLDRSLPVHRITRMLSSWPVEWPVAPIDHIYVGRAWAVADVRLGPDVGSDHRPIIATLVLR
jgi:endonuclease/exonuclease/phosphatase (EEP) superfamily protein YafD